MKKKFYTFTIEEHNGEQEYNYSMGCWANTEKAAIKKARSYAKQFYDIYDSKPDEVSENVFCFSNGIEVEMIFNGEENYDDFVKQLVSKSVIY